MNMYKYYSDVRKNAVFTEESCQFCGKNDDCLEGIYFEQEEIKSVCLYCLDKRKACVNIPSDIQNCVQADKNLKWEELKYTPPVPWVQFNEWQACCDDYMKYIGEWGKEDFILEAEDGNGIKLLKELLNDSTLSKVDDINVLWEDIGCNTVAFVFNCILCGRKKVVCQSF